MSLVYVIEDNQIMADCIALAIRGATETLADGTESEPPEVLVFNDAVSAMDSIDEALPDVILLDIMLSGPDGFTFLNELISYHDTAHIAVALITSLNLAGRNLEHYGVFRILDKGTMTPADIQAAVLDGIALTAERKATALPELIPDQPLAAQIEQFSPQAVKNLENAMESVTPAAVEELSAESSLPPLDTDLAFEEDLSRAGGVSPEAELSPEALAIIHGDVSTVMDTALGMPPTNLEADTEPITLSEPGALEDPAEPIDYLEIPQDGDTF